MTPERILLIGMMGAGKSTTGHRLAERLGWAYLDSDEEILRRTGRTVPEIWHERGESSFRAEETAVLDAAVHSEEDAVVAVAGGAVLDPTNRERLRAAGMVVWLRASTATLVARVGTGAGRPLLDGDAAGAVATLYEARRPIYADLADVVVDVEDRSPDGVVDAILAARDARRGGGADA